MRLRKRMVLGLVALVMVGVSMPEARAARLQPTAAAARPHTAPRNVTVMSFNACGALCRHGEVVRTAEHVVTVARQRNVDAVLLQELCYRQFQQIRRSLAPLGYAGRFAGTTRSRTCGSAFGVATLVRGPVSGSVVMPLPTSSGYEQRALLGVTARVGGRTTFVAVVHLSPSPAAGLDGQLAVVARYLDRRTGLPVIIGGDFNSLPSKPGLARFYSTAAGGTGHFVEADQAHGARIARGGAPTFDVAGRKIDYVFLAADAFAAARATSTATGFSDHRVYVATARPTSR
jgi:endonuclease/exonuclease/phosphatase family metal-dependent hydrolase